MKPESKGSDFIYWNIRSDKDNVEKQDYEDGSISVFFALILLCLIVFIFSIVDITRLQMIQLEAVSNYSTAGRMALSQYDPIALKQYGLFTGEVGHATEAIFKDALSVAFYPETAIEKTFLIDSLLEQEPKERTFSFMEPVSYQYRLETVPYLDETFQNPKEQILRYMSYREPYLFVQPFLENLSFISKTGKTSQVIEDKNALIQQLDGLDALKKELIYAVDGIRILSNNRFSFDSKAYFVRNLSYTNSINYKYFPVSMETGDDRTPLIMESELDAINRMASETEDVLRRLTHAAPFEYVYLEDPSLEEPLCVGVVFTETAQRDMDFIEKEAVPFFDEVPEFSEAFLKYRQTHITALEIIGEIEVICSESVLEIESFQANELQTEELLSGVKDELNKELEQVKLAISPNEFNLEEVDNLGLMKEKLTRNLSILNEALPTLLEMSSSLKDYTYKRYNNLRESATIANNQLELLDAAMNDLLQDRRNRTKSLGKNDLTTIIQNLETPMADYSTDLFFDYSDLEGEAKTAVDYEKESKTLESLDVFSVLKDTGLIQEYPVNTIDAATLPSFLFRENASIETADIEPESNQGVPMKTNLLALFGEIKEKVEAGHETLLLNEYIVGMFNNAQKSTSLNGKSVNGYNLEDHSMNYEAEYILGGHIDEQKNLNVTLGYLYGLRMGCNLIHLSLDAAKRTMIMNAANAIAGWWTGGVGAVVLAVLIGAFWALLESVVDVFLLVSGERVPFIKTSGSWYTDLKGNWEELLVVGVKRIDNEMTRFVNSAQRLISDGIESINTTIKAEADKTISEGVGITDDAGISDGVGISDDPGITEGALLYFQESLNELSEEVGLQVDYFNQTFDSQLDTYIDTLIRQLSQTDGLPDSKAQASQVANNPLALSNALEGGNLLEFGDPIEVSNPFKDGSAAYKLGEEIRYFLEEQYLTMSQLDPQTKDVIPKGVSSLVELKTQVKERFKREALEVKVAFQRDITRLFNTMIDEKFKDLDALVKDMTEKGMKVTKEMLHSQADEIKTSIKENLRDIQPNETVKSEFLPTFSYEDYLRIFLLLPLVNEKTKLARIMDLVQLNLQKSYKDSKLSLENYFIGLKITGSVGATPFFLFPIEGPRLKKEWNLAIEPIEVHYEY